MNKFITMGRATKKPEIRYTKDGKPVASMSLAVDRRFKQDGQPSADFFNCTAFGKTAEFLEKYVDKGTKLVCEGEMQNNNYQGKDGKMVYSFQYLVTSVEFAESKKQQVEEPKEYTEEGWMQIPDTDEDSLPFR